MTILLPDDTVVHRVGGGDIANLRLRLQEQTLVPPGISVLIEATPTAAAAVMRAAYPRSRKWHATSGVVGSATVGEIRAAGFDVVCNPTPMFPTHARLTHPDGVAGFDDAKLAALAAVFRISTGC